MPNLDPDDIESARTSETNRFVCRECFHDELLQDLIESAGIVQICYHCGKNDVPAVSLEWLADQVEEIYYEVVRTVDDIPYVTEDSDNVSWEQGGESPREMVAEITEVDDLNVADDIVSILASKNGFAVYKDGDFDWFDDTSECYKIKLEFEPVHSFSWLQFCKSVKHDQRFFNEQAKKILGEILAPLLSGAWPRNGDAVYQLKPDDDNSTIYRGRLALRDSDLKSILSAPVKNLGSPPPHLCGAGRMNAEGIRVFYGSFDPKTCLAELRAPVGGNVLVGAFDLTRPVRVLDLTVLDNADYRISFFEEDYQRVHSYNQFLRGFHDSIKRPVLPGAEPLDYLPTQVFCEYLANVVTPRIDGVIFGSSQISDSSGNIVLFESALHIEGERTETQRRIDAVYQFDDFGLSAWVAEDDVAVEDRANTLEIMGQNDTIKEQALSLRLIENGIKVYKPKSIDYVAENGPVHIYLNSSSPF